MVKVTRNYFGAGAIGAFLLVALVVGGGFEHSEKAEEGVVAVGAAAPVVSKIDWP
ncbi:MULTISPECIES: hypothetical protein [unclassified Streptomyces]|uniref:hypothetical protein n=1 Tax=unclassified Streptomyces TaxID=2593676 RepID=UPI000ACE24F7|nr:MULTISPECIES: hypothetical protein [unclassified Streptomyces]